MLSPDIVALIAFLILWCGVGFYSYGYEWPSNSFKNRYTIWDKILLLCIGTGLGLMTFLIVSSGKKFKNKWKIW